MTDICVHRVMALHAKEPKEHAPQEATGARPLRKAESSAQQLRRRLK
jgi:hypothetical protein